MSEKKAAVAIIGTGFAALAFGYEWSLAMPGSTLHFYESPQFQSASQIASGLLHLFHGQQARLPPGAREGLFQTLDLLLTLSHDQPLMHESVLLRPSRHTLQAINFKKRSKQYPEELSFGEVRLNDQTLNDVLTIHKAWIVDSPAYLKALKKELQARGSVFFTQELPENLTNSYEKVIIAAGANSLKLMKTLSATPLTIPVEGITTKGQLAVCQQVAPPNLAINAKAYILPLNEHRDTLIGATFERSFTSEEPEPSIERTRLWDEALQLWPLLASSEPQWYSALRLSGPEHLPFIGSFDSRLFVLGGLGSKGLLYHRLMAQKLVKLVTHPPQSKEWEIFPLKVLIDDLSY